VALILEGLVTTVTADGSPHLSPMGPEVDAAINRLVLKPYQTSITYQNLKRTGEGVFHVTDDVELIAHAAVGQLEPLPALEPAGAVRGFIVRDACRWFAFRVRSLDDSQPRTRIDCEVVDRRRLRDFFGFNRGKHAVLEAAILATRVDLLPAAEIRAQLDRLRVWVDKTGGAAEHRAFAFLEAFVASKSPPS